MLTGRPPFHGESAVAVAVQHVNDDAEPLRPQRPDLPQVMCDLVQRMMEKDPAARHPDAQALLNDVRRLLKAYKEAGPAQEAALAELASTSSASGRTGNARQIAVAVTACVLLAAAGAGIGWMQRTPLLLHLQRSTQGGVPVAASARDQYLQAQFSGGLEEEWEAVRKNWPAGVDEIWTIRATEQLALLYLKQPDRAEDARRELDKLASFNSDSPRYGLEAKLGEASLAVSASDRPDYRRAEAILNAARSEFEMQLTGSWRDRYERLRDEVAEKLHPQPSPE
jgi:eukaryotic-like serine/threonine-protein kinase